VLARPSIVWSGPAKKARDQSGRIKRHRRQRCESKRTKNIRRMVIFFLVVVRTHNRKKKKRKEKKTQTHEIKIGRLTASTKEHDWKRKASYWTREWSVYDSPYYGEGWSAQERPERGKGYWGVYRIGTTLSQITQSEFQFALLSLSSFSSPAIPSTRSVYFFFFTLYRMICYRQY
jgi:hypothetical protein